MTGEFNENSPIAFIYTLIRDEALCIELSDTEDDDSHHTKCHVSEHDETIENVTTPKPDEFKRQVLITVTTQPMVINPFAVLKQREIEQHGQPECGESACLEPNADDENNATNNQWTAFRRHDDCHISLLFIIVFFFLFSAYNWINLNELKRNVQFDKQFGYGVYWLLYWI